MDFSTRDDLFTLHPMLARFATSATSYPLHDALRRPSPLTLIASQTPLLVSARCKRSDQRGHQNTLLGPLLPLLWWPAFNTPPAGLPLTQVTLTDEALEAMLCAELLRYMQLSPDGTVPEWGRRVLNQALDQAARQRLFGQTSKLSQQDVADWLGLSRAQLAHQARLLTQPGSEAPEGEPAFFSQWQAAQRHD